jgi:aldehyde oxidoreductase
LRSTDVPPIEVILIEKAEKAGLAYGAKGIGEISSVAAAPAAAAAAYRVDGVIRTRLPLENTAYKPNR